MNEILNKLLLAGDTFMPEMHLRQPVFTDNTCGPFTKGQRKNTTIKKYPGNSRYIYQNELEKGFFFNMTWLVNVLKV